MYTSNLRWTVVGYISERVSSWSYTNTQRDAFLRRVRTAHSFLTSEENIRSVIESYMRTVLRYTNGYISEWLSMIEKSSYGVQYKGD